MKVVALAGGVGGSKLAAGLYAALPEGDLTVVVNTADDFDHLGLRICPDLDTVCYTLAGVANETTGWGRAGETWSFLETLGELGGPTWFRLGDRDLALHVERTRRLNLGDSLSAVTRQICESLKVRATVLPMTNERVETIVLTDRGDLGFQHYFVALDCEPPVRGFRFAGVEEAAPAPGVIEAIERAEVVIFCPSNPWVSLDPILALPGMRDAVKSAPVIGVSPIVGGKAVKGPAAKMFEELGVEPSSSAVAAHYRDLLDGLVIDLQDREQTVKIEALGIVPLLSETIMQSDEDRRRLAQEVLNFAATFEAVRIRA